jgi:hypothetical protein
VGQASYFAELGDGFTARCIEGGMSQVIELPEGFDFPELGHIYA